jgi:hypothetical protein
MVCCDEKGEDEGEGEGETKSEFRFWLGFDLGLESICRWGATVAGASVMESFRVLVKNAPNAVLFEFIINR